MSKFYAAPRTGLWRVFFGSSDPGTVAVVGAGGKTSLVKTLAAELSAMGRRVIITTTTKMHPPEDRALLCESVEALRTMLFQKSPVWAGIYYNEHKIEGLPVPLPTLSALADHVLIEADGAKKLPLKMIDAAHEPVIPPETDAVIAVAGLDGIGKPLSETVHRPALACEALGCSMEHVITPEDAARLLELCYHPEYVLFNKADTDIARSFAESAAACLPSARCVIASLRDFGYHETR